ncbi:hypothetical protein KP509_13G023600 [Ceratopteris richardii]|uniref:Uncharacterized protein n=1 Tax=Ceratopteris richardii TaxID=49495 RepID=A0A8T2THI5_CERRI|nr:hypothetical protein KP509_13G023600 [Ceratopteris richardii]
MMFIILLSANIMMFIMLRPPSLMCTRLSELLICIQRWMIEKTRILV